MTSSKVRVVEDRKEMQNIYPKLLSFSLTENHPGLGVRFDETREIDLSVLRQVKPVVKVGKNTIRRQVSDKGRSNFSIHGP